MALIISSKVRAKLASKVPPVTQEEVEQCFTNRAGIYLFEEREEHQSDPPTRWFVAETHFGRKLKVVFIPKFPDIILRTSYDANQVEIDIYELHGKR
jgi:hypothetical protein